MKRSSVVVALLLTVVVVTSAWAQVLPGLGFAVRTGGGAGELGSVGEYSWGGLGGTYFWIDPKEEMIAVWMAQGPGQREHYRRLFKSLVLQAIAD
jgi:CubicO group peptidase (beta-lactamase class C family)